MQNDLRMLTDSELDAVSGARTNLANQPGYHGPKIQVPDHPGAGDTIDGIPWGGQPGDGSWGTVNNNLPGGGPWGN